MAGLAKHRHPVEGGYQRGEETRARIVAAALKLFGERGFEGASTRDIATSAGVNAPALQYYFDSKEGVYIACVEHIVSRMWEYTSEAVERAEQALAENADDDALIDAYCAIQERKADLMFSSTNSDEWRLFMARQQAGGGPAAGFQLIQNATDRMSGVASEIIGRLLGRPANDDETLVRAATLTGQLSVFQLAKRSVLTRLNWESVDPERLALLKRIVREQYVALLRSMIVIRDSRRAAPPAKKARQR
jgi:TetR/AcrR family transcriptional regulator, regulator of cefoperazone and chloramphenicol sensitivity